MEDTWQNQVLMMHFGRKNARICISEMYRERESTTRKWCPN